MWFAKSLPKTAHVNGSKEQSTRRGGRGMAAAAAGLLILATQVAPAFAMDWSRTGSTGDVTWGGKTLAAGSVQRGYPYVGFPKLTVSRSSAYAGPQVIVLQYQTYFYLAGLWSEVKPELWPIWTGTEAAGQQAVFNPYAVALPYGGTFNTAVSVKWETTTGAVLGTLSLDFNNSTDYGCTTTSGCTVGFNGGYGTVTVQ